MRTKTQIYLNLENKMVKYCDLIRVEVRECGESFVTLPLTGNAVVGRYDELVDMQSLFPEIPVRRTVGALLQQANERMQVQYPDYQLIVSYGFRSLEVQTLYFEKKKNEIEEYSGLLNQDEVFEMVHRSVAVPAVAGHPTGGAVDVYIKNLKTNLMLDFGTKLYDLKTKDAYTMSPFITSAQKKNRLLLRETMMEIGFAPYDGEWWHFSYGDREWAYFYEKPFSHYSQQSVKEVKEMLE